MADHPLTEALETSACSWSADPQHKESDPDCHVCIIDAAARRWAELEALVADGGRVVVEKRCVHGQIVHKWHPSEQVRLQLSDGCEGGESRVVLGEGAE